MRARVLACAIALAIVAAACGSSGSKSSASLRGQTVTLLTHDFFAASKDVLAAFTQQTGIKVRVVKSGDAGTMVNQAILTKDHPVGDALFGIDNTFLTRGVDAGLFQSRSYQGLDALEPSVRTALAQYEHDAVPVDQGDVCLNYDKVWFAAHHVAPPATIADLTKPAYKGLTVVENPATSSPGLAFLVATITELGGRWQQYWKDLRANKVLAVDDWGTAYDDDFTAGGGKDATRPIVVSYASSPPADIVFADPPKTTTAVGVVDDGCFRQYELAGVLAHAKHPDAAQRLVEFLLSARFQADMPLQMFVWPVRSGTTLPKVFADNAHLVAHPVTVSPTDIARHRSAWIDTWTNLVTG